MTECYAQKAMNNTNKSWEISLQTMAYCSDPHSTNVTDNVIFQDNFNYFRTVALMNQTEVKSFDEFFFFTCLLFVHDVNLTAAILDAKRSSLNKHHFLYNELCPSALQEGQVK